MDSDQQSDLGSHLPAWSGDPVDRELTAASNALLVRVLTKLRKRAGLTQAELGSRLGERQKFVSDVETGRRRVLTLEEARQIAEAIGPPAAALLAHLIATEALLHAYDTDDL